ncbi:MAG TPA: hypothetical protein VF260_06365 [Bacilli bacterium]
MPSEEMLAPFRFESRKVSQVPLDPAANLSFMSSAPVMSEGSGLDTIYDDKFTVEFKTDVTVDVNE